MESQVKRALHCGIQYSTQKESLCFDIRSKASMYCDKILITIILTITIVKNNNNNNINNYSRFLRVPETSVWRPLKRMKKLDRMKIYTLNTAEIIQVLYYEHKILFYCCTLT